MRGLSEREQALPADIYVHLEVTLALGNELHLPAPVTLLERLTVGSPVKITLSLWVRCVRCQTKIRTQVAIFAAGLVRKLVGQILHVFSVHMQICVTITTKRYHLQITILYI